MTTPPVPAAGPAASPTPQPVPGAPAPERQEHTLTAIRAHHRALGEAVVEGALSVWESVDRLTPGSHQSELVALCEREVLPHAAAEERTLYRAGIDLPAVAPMIRAMLAEHTTLRDAVDRLAAAHSPGRIAGAAGALGALFLSHLDKENDILLPALVDAGVDLAAVLDGMHEILGPAGAAHGPADHAGSGCGCADGAGGCGCGEHADTGGDTGGDDRGEELDVRALPHAARHVRILAVFEALPPGGAFVLVNDHDPVGLRRQFEAEYPGRFGWDYLQSGPRVWRVRIVRARVGGRDR